MDIEINRKNTQVEAHMIVMKSEQVGVCPRRDPHISQGMFSERNPLVAQLNHQFISSNQKIRLFFILLFREKKPNTIIRE